MNNALPTITLLPPILGETVLSINRFNIENPSLIYLCEKTMHRAICFCSVAIADRNRQTFHKRARTYWQQCTDGVAPFDSAILCWKENFSPSHPAIRNPLPVWDGVDVCRCFRSYLQRKPVACSMLSVVCMQHTTTTSIGNGCHIPCLLVWHTLL